MDHYKFVAPLIITLSYTLLLLKIYDYRISLCLVALGLFVAYKRSVLLHGTEKRKLFLGQMAGLLAIGLIYWYYFMREQE